MFIVLGKEVEEIWDSMWFVSISFSLGGVLVRW